MEGDVELNILVDSDDDPSTGYGIDGVGADLMVRSTATFEGGVRGSVLQWGKDYRFPSGNTRTTDDWNGWAGAPGSVEVSVSGKRLELKATLEDPFEDGAKFLIYTADAFGQGDSADVSVDGRNPSLLVEQRPILPDVVKTNEVDALELTFTAFGGNIKVENAQIRSEGANVVQGLATPLSIKSGGSSIHTLPISLDAVSEADLVLVGIDGPGFVEAGNAIVSLDGHVARAYADQAPSEVVIDGAFGDWSTGGTDRVDDADGDVVWPPWAEAGSGSVDLSAVSAKVGIDDLSLFAQVTDGMMVGVMVPYLPSSTPQGAVDRDGDGRLDLNGDGIEDDFGSRDDDWDNDHGQDDDPETPFRDTGTDEVDEDDDNDGVPDVNDPTRGGPHVPGPPADLPPLEGRDTVEFLLNTDGEMDSGYSPDGYLLGADHRIVVVGREGRITEARITSHDASGPAAWSWRNEGDVDIELDSTRLEVGVPLSSIDVNGNITVLVRATGWTGAKDWSDRLIEGQVVPGGPLGVGDAIGAIDPWAVTVTGGFSISPTGDTWTSKDGPTDPGAFVDLAVGHGPLAGYIYSLTSKGKVMVTTRAVSGWTEYGQGLPVIPTSSAYVAIAAGHGSQVGYVYVLRNDGSVFVCDRATSGWSKYGQGTPTIPASTAYVDIAAGPDGLEGYVYVLRADGKVYVTDSAVRGWSLYGQGNPSLPSGAPDYRAIAAGDGTNRGSVFIMRGSGDVYIATSAVTGWSRYAPGTPGLPSSEGFVDMDASTISHPGRVLVVRNDGEAYVADSAVGGWSKYGQGTPVLPSTVGYSAIALGSSDLPGYTYVLGEDGKTYMCDNAVRGWSRYGTGTPALPSAGGHTSVTGLGSTIFLLSLDGTVVKSTNGGDDWSSFGSVGTYSDGWVSMCVGSDGNLYALRRDGTVRTSSSGSSSWSDHGDAGSGTSWTSIGADDNGYLYTLRSDGAASYAQTSSSTWTSKGDVGDGTGWVAITAFDGSGDVFAMRSDRVINKATAGTSTSWSAWATAGGDYSWVSAATNGTHLFALRNDGRVDRATLQATPSWTTSFGDTGDDTGWTDIAVPIPEFQSLLLQAFLTAILIQIVRRRVVGRGAVKADDPPKRTLEPED
jgi:hypothetical protein